MPIPLFEDTANKYYYRWLSAPQYYGEIDGFTRVVSNEDVREKGNNLSVPLYVKPENGSGNGTGEAWQSNLKAAVDEWQKSSIGLRESMEKLFDVLGDIRL